MIVVDASVVASALADDGPDVDLARRRLGGETLAAPELVDLEVISVMRKGLLVGGIPLRRAQMAFADLADLGIRCVPHRLLQSRMWECGRI